MTASARSPPIALDRARPLDRRCPGRPQACRASSGDDDEPAPPGDEASVADALAGDDSVSPPLSSLAGGVELSPVDPAALFVGDGSAYGTPLPSESAAVEAFADDAEVAGVELRRFGALMVDTSGACL